MDIQGFTQKLKEKAGGKAGMVLVHNGVVREFSRDGSPVAAIDIEVDYHRLDEIMAEARKMEGIVAAAAQVRQGHLEVGDDVMLLGIAGDIRDNVFAAMIKTLNAIKSGVTRKKEIAP